MCKERMLVLVEVVVDEARFVHASQPFRGGILQAHRYVVGLARQHLVETYYRVLKMGFRTPLETLGRLSTRPCTLIRALIVQGHQSHRQRQRHHRLEIPPTSDWKPFLANPFHLGQ